MVKAGEVGILVADLLRIVLPAAGVPRKNNARWGRSARSLAPTRDLLGWNAMKSDGYFSDRAVRDMVELINRHP